MRTRCSPRIVTVDSQRALTTEKWRRLSNSWLSAGYLRAEFAIHCDTLFGARSQRKEHTSVLQTPALNQAGCPAGVCCITASLSVPPHFSSHGFDWSFTLFLPPLNASVLNLLSWCCCHLWSQSESSQLSVLAFCKESARGFHASPELPALPLPIRTLEARNPEATTFAQ